MASGDVRGGIVGYGDKPPLLGFIGGKKESGEKQTKGPKSKKEADQKVGGK